MILRLFAVLAVLTFSAAVSAQGYAVVSAGSSDLNADCSGTTTCDNSGTGFKLLGGYKFTPNMAAEFGYFDFGKATATLGALSAENKNSAIGGGVAFHQNIATNWPLVARLGIASVKTTISSSIPGFGSASDSESNIALYGGLGIGYRVSPTMSIDGAWDFSKSKYGDESGNISVLSLGLTFWF